MIYPFPYSRGGIKGDVIIGLSSTYDITSSSIEADLTSSPPRAKKITHENAYGQVGIENIYLNFVSSLPTVVSGYPYVCFPRISPAYSRYNYYVDKFVAIPTQSNWSFLLPIYSNQMYGIIYNWRAANEGGLAADKDGWWSDNEGTYYTASSTDMDALTAITGLEYVGGENIISKNYRGFNGITHGDHPYNGWSTPTNDFYNFNLITRILTRASSGEWRTNHEHFSGTKWTTSTLQGIWLADMYDGTNPYVFVTGLDSNKYVYGTMSSSHLIGVGNQIPNTFKILNNGTPLRVYRDATSLESETYSNGEILPTTTTDNIGNVYTLVYIANRVWVREFIAETMPNFLSTLPLISGSVSWTAASFPAATFYGFDTNTPSEFWWTKDDYKYETGTPIDADKKIEVENVSYKLYKLKGTTLKTPQSVLKPDIVLERNITQYNN